MAKKRRAALLLGIAFAAVTPAVWRFHEPPPRVPTLTRGTSALQTSRRFSLRDPLSPERAVFTLEQMDPAFPGVAARHSGNAWVRARPNPAFRHERTPQERGGIDPCALPAPQRSGYLPWKSLAGRSYVAMPRVSAVRQSGDFDTMLVFHGHDVALTQLAQTDAAIVLYGSTLANYRSELSGPEALGQLISAIEARVSDDVKRPARARHVALAAWSGGYEAIGVLLEQSRERARVDAVLLLDGLHSSRDPEVMRKQLGPFVAIARRAARREAFVFAAHSSVDTDGFASTTETMHFLASELGGKPLRVWREDPLGLQLVELFERGDFHLRGYAGGGKRDHCAALGLYPMATRALARIWQSGVVQTP